VIVCAPHIPAIAFLEEKDKPVLVVDSNAVKALPITS
jgi:hypothetical protein